MPHHFSSHHSKGWNNEEGYMDANGDYFDKTFDCKVIPNPSSTYFNLQIESASDEKIEVNLLDCKSQLN